MISWDDVGQWLRTDADTIGSWFRTDADTLGAFVSQPVSGFVPGIALTLIALIVLIFGAALVISAYDKSGRPDLPRWHPRRWVAPRVDFFVGLLLIQLDGILYAYLAGSLLLLHGSVPLWFAAMSMNGCFLSLKAFQHFAQDRRRV